MKANERAGSGQTGDRATVVISSPEELIASIPAMLGFPPGPGSVVVMCGETADGRQGPVVRMDVAGLIEDSSTVGDLDDDPAPIDEGAARGLAHFCAREGVSGVHLVVVHTDCVDGYGAGLRAEDAAAAFEFWLGSVGTQVIAAYGVGEFTAGAPWVDLFGMERGVQLDPDSTEIAAVHAFDGRVRAASRGGDRSALPRPGRRRL